ncbi:hypothetical protein [uncultured Rummeliibacillus sp.]|uniref:hypothetical protein n=1 Tax=uncultured Rummeliibacillus sp. TaxID=762292 RepID=UPI0026360D8B|nr:hypothetical protein [uncultured Rummeliibacillus sp.]
MSRIMYVSPGKENFKRNSQSFQSILDIHINQKYILAIFPGSLSINDYLIKYREVINGKKTRLRTPKHIHWVTDLLIKKECNPKLTDKLIYALLKSWNNSSSISNLNKNSIVNILKSSKVISNMGHYSVLSKYGFYDIEFLIILAELLAVQEKTNNSNAYMFRHVLEKSLTNDLFSIISTATHNGR